MNGTDSSNPSVIDLLGDEPQEEKELSLFQKLNPLRKYFERRQRERLEEEERLLRRDALMHQDIERFLMQIEDRRSWVTHELNYRNYTRLVRDHHVLKLHKEELRKAEIDNDENTREQGLSFFRGQIDKYTRWQNSPAKHLDLKGHTDTVNSCKLSRCLTYVLTCSTDKTARLWIVKTGKCMLSYVGHTKKVYDGDMHVDFKMNKKEPLVITCSGDCTIKFWSTQHEKPLRSLQGHNEAIYKCAFAPNGQRFLTCSEDTSMRMWAFPDGYCLYVYRRHTAPVTSISFSPSGRFFASCSDYGERKLLLWDASMPRFEKAIQFPHIFFWTPAGLIKKICIEMKTPKDTFWLSADQTKYLPANTALETFPGENDNDPDIPSDSDDEEEADDDDDMTGKKKFGDDDVRDRDGFSIQIIGEDEDGDPIPAVEYVPGYRLAFQIESVAGILVDEVYIAVYAYDSLYDIFSPIGGQRLGHFNISFPMPWDLEEALKEAKGNINKAKRPIPPGLSVCAGDQACVYLHQSHLNEEGEVVHEPVNFGIVWFCCGPDLGPAFVNVSYRLKDSSTWLHLKYSLKESAMRMNAAPQAGALQAQPERFNFDQEGRHTTFWNFVRDKNWDGVHAMLDKKAVVYHNKLYRQRQWRVCDTIERIFAEHVGIVVPTPFIFKSGITRSVAMAEAIPYSLKFESDSEEEEDESDEDGSNDDDVNEVEENAGDEEEMLEVDEEDGVKGTESLDGGSSVDIASKVDESISEGSILNPGVDGENVYFASELLQDGLESSRSNSLKNSSVHNSKKGSDKIIGSNSPKSEGEDENKGGIDEGEEEEEEKEREEERDDDGSEREDENNDRDDEISNASAASADSKGDKRDSTKGISESTKDTSGSTSSKGVLSSDECRKILIAYYTVFSPDKLDDNFIDTLLKKYAGKESVLVSMLEKKYGPLPSENRGVENSEGVIVFEVSGSSGKQESKNIETDIAVADSGASDIKKIQENEPESGGLSETLANPKVSFIATEHEEGASKDDDDKDRDPEIQNDDMPSASSKMMNMFKSMKDKSMKLAAPKQIDDVFVHRPKARKLHLPEIVFLGEFGGTRYMSKIRSMAKHEARQIIALRRDGVPMTTIDELRQYPIQISRVEFLQGFAEAPVWFSTFFDAVQHRRAILKKKIMSNPSVSVTSEGSSNLLDGINNFPVATHVLQKGERFGPSIEKFTMELPEVFPQRAGMAAYALRHQLWDTAERFRKAQGNLIPTSVDNVSSLLDHKPGILDGVLAERRELQSLETSLFEDVSLHVLAEGMYVGTRRNACPMIPGMEPHYPNTKYYPEPALDIPVDDFKLKSSSVLSLFGMTSAVQEIVPPVGKKPHWWKRRDESESKTDDQFNEAGKPMSAEELLASIAKKEADAKAVAHAAKMNKHAKYAIHHDHRHHGNASTPHPEKNSENEGAADDSTVDDNKKSNSEDTGKQMASLKTANEEEAAKRLKKEQKIRAKLGIPLDVFLGRRGSFPLAPGLEPFSGTVKAPLSHSASPQGAKSAVITSAKLSDKHASDEKKLNADLPAAEDESDSSSEASSSSSSSVSSYNEDEDAYAANETKRGVSMERDPAEDELHVVENGGLIRKFLFRGLEVVHHGAVRDVQFSPSEKRVATGGSEGVIKLWDPRDGTFVRSLKGHKGEVTGLRYTIDELYLVSCGADSSIMMWDLTKNEVQRCLRGHNDVITCISISPDASLIVSTSFDFLAKTWYLSPRHPDQPEPPRVIAITDSSALLKWSAPPSFNLEITAFFFQYRIGKDGEWTPTEEEGVINVAPVFRSKNISGLTGATNYQFRMMAENRMGKSAWSNPSKIATTEYGIPERLERPTIIRLHRHSMVIYWFAPNPETYGSASKIFEIQYSGEGKSFDENPTLTVGMDEVRANGEAILDIFREIIKPKKALYGRHKVAADPRLEGYIISEDRIRTMLQKIEEDPHFLFVSTEIPNLNPGFMYRVQIRPVNPAGPGAWSERSYSMNTKAAPPNKPNPPRILEAFLTSIKFTWDEPHDNGASIIGYTLQVQHTGREYRFGRSENTYLLDFLQPGKSYFVRVMADNVEGPSEWSDWNDVSQSRTMTDKPEIPRNPRAVAGTWSTMSFDGKLIAILSYHCFLSIFLFPSTFL